VRLIDEQANRRRGQANFRNRLTARYGNACQISRCVFPGLLEAAHIRPYAETNDNGLLLRSDLHTLFDLDMLAINPSTLTVALHRDVRAAGYEAFDGIQLFVNGTSGPDLAALADRWESFQLRHVADNAPSQSVPAAILLE
jgi:putative restriction endonuclease